MPARQLVIVSGGFDWGLRGADRLDLCVRELLDGKCLAVALLEALEFVN
ncbi:MAG: hypothetical protein OXC25_15865 [Thiotrichales bacterium]|nr:hypothetical protein [Thiotrichales bacterium]MCY4351316.1 hypothetical protein [Thiotrichales bacterium]